MNEPILSVKNLQISFKTFAGEVQAIRGVSFDLHKGETLAIVGESGSGKTVTTRSIMGLLSKNAIIKSGEVIFNGDNLLQYKERQMRDIRGTQIAMIFQDPMTSLNPTLTIGQQIMEILTKQRGMSKSEAIEETIDLLTLCGIRDPEARLKQYPHQFSGGQRQRIVIAIALAG
ncbi:MAG TPA: ABC transporter ATP-binding protein, partial [Globicatella sulfidifaciens]|nr:ABC transporter ATP-binding protein [Globicatella sulfidifaciens]